MFVQMLIDQFLFYGALPLFFTLLVLAGTWLPQFRSSSARLRRDWAKFSWIIYLFVIPLFIMITLDEYQGEAPYQTAGFLIYATGALISLRPSRSDHRLFVLLIAVAAIASILSYGKHLLYPQQVWLSSTVFQPGWDALGALISGVAIEMTVSIPALLRLLPKNFQQLEDAF
jgi:hypothetical protein